MLVQLLERLGARYVADVAPSGGRHIYALFAASLPWRELRDVCRAFSRRFPAIDPAPMANLGGQISPPGSRHKSGGWRLLTTSLEDAGAVVEHPNGPEVWNVLLTEFTAELQCVVHQVDDHDGHHVGHDSVGAELDETGVPWIPRPGGRAPLGAELEQAARAGRWDRSRYPGRSEIRMAVLGAAAVRGWQLTDVREAVASGAWRGFETFYHRASEPGRLERLLEREFRKSVAFVSGSDSFASETQATCTTRPRVGDSGAAAEYGLIRQWMTAVDCAIRDPQRVRGWGGRTIAVRLVLLALAQAAMVSGSSVTEHGTRNLSLHSAVSHHTVARVLRMLASEDDPLIDLVTARRMARADRWQLRIPARYADSVRWRRRRAGRIEAAHPVFLVLGGT